MYRCLILAVVAVVIYANSALRAQEPAMPVPEKEHQWLERFVGSRETEMEASMGPDQPPMKCRGTMTTRALGGFWIVNDIKGDMAGAPMSGIQTIGYDPTSEKYVGTWIDSLTSHLWKYEGKVDEAGRVLTLDADGPNFTEAGKMAKFRDVYEFKSADHIVATSSMLGEDGSWTEFMRGNLRRMK